MHAAMLTADLYEDSDNALAAVSAASLAIIEAQQAAMYAALTASAAAANSGN